MSRPDPAATTSLLVADDGWCSTCTVCGLAGNIMLCEFGCADADSVAVCCLAYHPACLGLSKAPKEQFVCPRHGRHSTIPARKLPHKVQLQLLRFQYRHSESRLSRHLIASCDAAPRRVGLKPAAPRNSKRNRLTAWCSCWNKAWRWQFLIPREIHMLVAQPQDFQIQIGTLRLKSST
jgi:hypothetical protein